MWQQKAISLLSELEKKAGLIERKRQGLGKPNLIYVKNFIPPVQHIQKCPNHTSENVLSTSVEMAESHRNHTDHKHTEYNDTDIHSFPNRKETVFSINSYDQHLWESLDMDALLIDSPDDHDLLMELYDLIRDTVNSNKKSIRISGDDKPIDVVRAQFLKLTREITWSM